MIKSCPDPVDVQDLQFKLHCRLKVFDNKKAETFPNAHNLVTCASRYGLLFIGSNSNNLQVVQLKCIENYNPKVKEILDYPKRNFSLPSQPRHLSVNCDSTVIAIVVEKDNCPTVLFYDVLSFLKQNISQIQEVRLSPTPNTFISEVNWNPTIPGVFTACKSDGTLGVYELKGNSVEINELPAASGASCFCWSPRGKQIAVGSKDGKITQYKPDLKAVKVINPPTTTSPYSLISLQWVSNFQFIGVYRASDGQAFVIVVDAPKTGENSFTNYDDICYSGSSRHPQYYMVLQPHWNILMVASSNGTEVGVMGNSGDSWIQWIMNDSARAELPLSSDHQDTLPLGLALDTSSTQPLPWGESTIPPAPLLLVLSHHGLLCIFDVINLKSGVPNICTPPDPIQDLSGLSFFVAAQPQAPQQVQPPATQPLAAMSTPLTSQPLFSGTQSTLFTTKPTVSSQPPPAYGISQITAEKSATAPFFTGQATIAPIKPPQQTPAPLFGGQTVLAPIEKVVSSSAPIPATQSKYPSIFSAVTAPTKPIATTAAPNKTLFNNPPPDPKSNILTIPQPVPAIKPQPTPAVVEKTSLSTTKSDPIILAQAETDAMLAQMIRDECVSLESELKALLHQGQSLKINLGSDAENSDMIKQVDSLQDFLKEVVDISVGQKAEVHYLKQNFVQSWAWYEEARSRYNASKDETMSILLRAEPLDSASDKHLKNIQHSMYYLESQLTQASKALDEQWDNFQDYAKKTHRTQMPTMETIFQTMVRQHAVLQKQSYVLKDISSRVRSKTRSTGPSLLVSMDNTDDLDNKMQQLQLEPQNICQVQYERVLNRSKLLTKTKTEKLRNLLKNRGMTHVTATKPKLNSSILHQSPISKSKQLISILGAQMSPVPKTAAVKNLDFNQSTPKREMRSALQYSMQTPPNTPSEVPERVPATSFLPKSSSSVFSNIQSAPTQSFSAFVPTTQLVASTTTAFAFSNSKTSAFSAATSTPSQTLAFAGTTKTVTTATPVSITSSAPFSFTNASASLPKFGSSITPISKTGVIQTTTSIVTGITAILKTSSASATFSFGGKTTASNPNLITSTPKPLSFGGGTTLFGVNSAQNVPASNNKTVSSPGVSSSSSIFAIPKVTEVSSSTPLFSSAVVTSSVKESEVFVSPPTFGITPISTAPTTSSSVFLATTTSKSVFTATSSIASTPTSSTSLLSNLSQTNKTDDSKSVQSSFFGSTVLEKAPLTQSTLFGGAVTLTPISSAAGTPASKPSIFGSAAPSITSIFGGSTVITPTVPATATTTPKSAPQSTGFVTPPALTSSPLLLSSTAQSTASITSFSTSSIFAGAPVSSTATVVTTSTSIFGGNTATSTTKPSLFGALNTASVAQAVPFGATAAATSSSSSATIFATPSPTQGSIFSGFGTTTQAGSLFGKPTAVATTVTTPILAAQSSPQSMFGSTTTTSTSIFASALASTANSVPSSVGSPVISTASVFGAKTNASSVFSPAFAGTTAPVATSPFEQKSTSVFGGATTTSATVFGTGQITFGGSSGFESTAPASTAASVFGQQSSFGTAPSAFGSAQTTNSAFGSGTSVFGTPTSSTASPFGTSGTSSNVFGAVPAEPSSFSFAAAAAGQPSPASSFGFGGLNVGAGTTSTSSGSIFGQTPTTGIGANPFGKEKSVFGGGTASSSTSSSIFGTNTGATTFGGSAGGQSQGFGSPSNFATPGFGQAPGAFGQNQSTFGSSSFSSTPQPGPFSSGQSTAQSGFGSPSSFQKAPSSGFGSAPVFGGGSPAFGANPSFGGAATFGAAPAFGSPTKVFGESAPTAGAFGAPANPQSSAFGNLANQNTVGFGNLAQQAATPQNSSAPFSGNASFSSWR